MSEEEKRRVGRPATGVVTKKGMRIPDDLWNGMKAATEAEGTNTPQVTREFYAWYLRRPGAKLPHRPQVEAAE